MYSRSSLAKKYLQYYLTAANGKGHGIHSPFVYNFVRKVLNDGHHYAEWKDIEDLRERLGKDHTKLLIEDMGAGSAIQATRERTVSSLARHAAKSAKLGRLLFRIARYYQPSNMVELGTSLGISASYLAKGAPGASLYTMEGAGAVADRAEQNFVSLELGPKLIRGNFDESLVPLLHKIGQVDLAFVDGNHRCEPTLRYFRDLLQFAAPSSILIFDDIHWSQEMETAWETIKDDPAVMLTIDLFFIGLVILRPEFKVKQHFTIRY